MYRIAIPMLRMYEHSNIRPQRSKHNPERAVEAYFAVMTIVILGMILGLAAYMVRTVIPEWQESHFRHVGQSWMQSDTRCPTGSARMQEPFDEGHTCTTEDPDQLLVEKPEVAKGGESGPE